MKIKIWGKGGYFYESAFKTYLHYSWSVPESYHKYIPASTPGNINQRHPF